MFESFLFKRMRVGLCFLSALRVNILNADVSSWLCLWLLNRSDQKPICLIIDGENNTVCFTFKTHFTSNMSFI